MGHGTQQPFDAQLLVWAKTVPFLAGKKKPGQTAGMGSPSDPTALGVELLLAAGVVVPVPVVPVPLPLPVVPVPLPFPEVLLPGERITKGLKQPALVG